MFPSAKNILLRNVWNPPKYQLSAKNILRILNLHSKNIQHFVIYCLLFTKKNYSYAENITVLIKTICSIA
jgi:hypothetical protein